METATVKIQSSLTQIRLLLAGILLLWTPLALAQLPTGAISGRVVDGSGAAIPNATMTVTNRETGRVQTTQTSAGGNYKITLLSG